MAKYLRNMGLAAGRLRFALRIAWLKLLHGRAISSGWRGWLAPDTEIIVGRNAKMQIGYLELSRGCKISVEDGSKLTIDSGAFFNRGCTIVSKVGVFIGGDTIFGENVKIFDHDHIHVPQLQKNQFRQKPIYIGRGCWFGSNVIVLKGTTIGDNVTVGANCVISSDVPSDTVVTISAVYNTRLK